MANDVEVLRQVWHSYLPVTFRLAQNEVTSLQEPDPYYAMVARLSYFPLVIDKAIKHLMRFQTQQNTRDLWLDFEGIPLKWHYPIGLLWDLLGADSSSASLPWTLTVHFRDFPEEALIRCNSRASIESAFMSALKEADALKHRSQVMSSLQKKDHNQLWLGLQNQSFDQFWAVNRKLMAADDAFRFIPFRVYFQDLSQRQKLLRPQNADSGAATTFGDLCRAVTPTDCHTISSSSSEEYRFVVQGIEPPGETPLQWLSEHLSYPDNFLHICAQRKTN